MSMSMSVLAKKRLGELLQEHNLHDNSSTEQCMHDSNQQWDFLKQSHHQDTKKSHLFRTIVSIMQKQISNTNQIIKECSQKMSQDDRVLRLIDIPASLDSAHTIYAALIFLSSAIEETTSCNAATEFFPAMPILDKNETSPSNNNAYPVSFTLSDEFDINDEYLEKLDNLEALFFKSSTGENDYVSRLRVIPRSVDGGGASKEESFLKLGEVKKITRKRQIRKVDVAASASASAKKNKDADGDV